MQDNSNTPPFAIGQKVVALVDQTDGDFLEGSMHIVAGLSQCPKCKLWCIDISRRGPFEKIYKDSCCCGFSVIRYNEQALIWYGSNLFAPIQTQYADMTKEIANSVKETSEVPDKILIPETAN